MKKCMAEELREKRSPGMKHGDPAGRPGEGNGKRTAVVVVASHKPYRMPDDRLYLPVLVGAEKGTPVPEGFHADNTGENISEKNPGYCELTGLYWAWKNLRADYIGLAHYRRHFAVPGFSADKWKRILGRKQCRKLTGKADVILPSKRHYWIETNYSQYVHAHHAEDLDITRKIIGEQCPDYLASFDRIMKRTSGHRFNMFIMERSVLDSYCRWLFGILFALEEQLDTTDYSSNDARVFGFVAERLLDVWIDRNGISYIEIPYLFMEKENWIRKGGRFLARKFIGKKNRQTPAARS